MLGIGNCDYSNCTIACFTGSRYPQKKGGSIYTNTPTFENLSWLLCEKTKKNCILKCAWTSAGENI